MGTEANDEVVTLGEPGVPGVERTGAPPDGPGVPGPLDGGKGDWISFEAL
jgi:hypothetical protein